jgi:mono/diheme cytochrome c family protein
MLASFMRSHLLIHAVFAACALPGARAAAPEQIEFFEKQVRPVLADQCYKCHGPEKQKGGLRIDSREALLKGGEDGAVVVPGKPEESSFIKSINHIGDSKMPEKADKLPDAQIAALSEWVKMGVPWPENDKPVVTAAQSAAKTHWSFQPVANPAVPEIQNPKSAIRNPIDAFLLAKLEPAGLGFAPPADKRTLLRRATFDLTGLPPTAEEVAAFESDAAPDAFAKVIDRLLASPRYGERWGRYCSTSRATRTRRATFFKRSANILTPTPFATGSSAPSTMTCRTIASSSTNSPPISSRRRIIRATSRRWAS